MWWDIFLNACLLAVGLHSIYVLLFVHIIPCRGYLEIVLQMKQHRWIRKKSFPTFFRFTVYEHKHHTLNVICGFSQEFLLYAKRKRTSISFHWIDVEHEIWTNNQLEYTEHFTFQCTRLTLHVMVCVRERLFLCAMFMFIIRLKCHSKSLVAYSFTFHFYRQVWCAIQFRYV